MNVVWWLFIGFTIINHDSNYLNTLPFFLLYGTCLYWNGLVIYVTHILNLLLILYIIINQLLTECAYIYLEGLDLTFAY